jgi:hypothetical protein
VTPCVACTQWYAVCARDEVEHADDDTLTVTAKDIFGG